MATSSSATELLRLKMARGPLAKWSIRERLTLACSVMRSGDQNWVSVSRAIKPFGEPGRPPDWFSQKNCALQYNQLLEKVELPKRKRSERGEMREIPENVIMRKLTIERIEELKQKVKDEEAKYKLLKKEVELISEGKMDDSLEEMIEEIEDVEPKEEPPSTPGTPQPSTSEETGSTSKSAMGGRLKRDSSHLKIKMPGSETPEESTKEIECIVDTGDVQVVETEVITMESDPIETIVETTVHPKQKSIRSPPSPLLSSLFESREAIMREQDQQMLEKQNIEEMILSGSPAREEEVTAEDQKLIFQPSSPSVSEALTEFEGIDKDLLKMKLDLTEDEIDEIREGIDTTDIDISLADTCSQDIPSPPVVEQEVKEEPHESSCSEDTQADKPSPKVKVARAATLSTTDAKTPPKAPADKAALADKEVSLSGRTSKKMPAEKESPVEARPSKKIPAEKGSPIEARTTRKTPAERESPIEARLFRKLTVEKESPVEMHATRKLSESKSPIESSATRKTPVKKESPIESRSTRNTPAEKESPIESRTTRNIPAGKESPIGGRGSRNMSSEKSPVAARSGKKMPVDKESSVEVHTSSKETAGNESPVAARVTISEMFNQQDEVEVKTEEKKEEEVEVKKPEKEVIPEVKIEEPVKEEEPEVEPEVIKEEELVDIKEEPIEYSTPDTPTLRKVVAAMMDADDPPSPASSVDTETGSVRARSRRSRGGKVRGRGSRGRPRRHPLEEKKESGSSKPSEAESSDDDIPQESDDTASNITTRPFALCESIPNSPSSITHSDVEDEKAFKTWKKSIMLVWRMAANHKYANVFMHPVSEDIAPGYRAVVNRPMDLVAIKKNVELGLMRTTEEFQRDMMLMFTNAIMYNSSDHNVYHMAQEMYDDVMAHIEVVTSSLAQQQYVSTQLMVQSEAKVLRASRTRAETTSDKEDEVNKRKPIPPPETGGKKKRKSCA